MLMGQKKVFCICRNDIMASLSPACFRMCTVRLLFREKACPQSLQRYGFSPVCTVMCLLGSDGYEKLFLHSRQTSLALADFAGSLVDSCCPSKLLCGSGSLRSC